MNCVIINCIRKIKIAHFIAQNCKRRTAKRPLKINNCDVQTFKARKNLTYLINIYKGITPSF